MRSVWIILFAMTAGFTASGIVANLYRVCTPSSEKGSSAVLRGIVMIVAGPNVIFETAIRAFVRKEWSPSFFWLVSAGLAYWSLAIGLFILDVAVHIPAE
jgi:hypothetical protein